MAWVPRASPRRARPPRRGLSTIGRQSCAGRRARSCPPGVGVGVRRRLSTASQQRAVAHVDGRPVLIHNLARF